MSHLDAAKAQARSRTRPDAPASGERDGAPGARRAVPPATQPPPTAPPPPARTDARESTAHEQNDRVDLGRIAWLTTVIGCLVAVVVLALNGYTGYAAVTFAVAVSAAINLT